MSKGIFNTCCISSAMEELRRAAFADLAAERLLADEAFIILQNHLRDELASIQSRLRVTPAENSPT